MKNTIQKKRGIYMPNLHDIKKAGQKAKHDAWLKGTNVNQKSTVRQGKKRDQDLRRNSKAAKRGQPNPRRGDYGEH